MGKSVNTARLCRRPPAWKNLEAAVLEGRIPCGVAMSASEILACTASSAEANFENYMIDLRLQRSPVRFRVVPGTTTYKAESTAPVAAPTSDI